MVGLASVQRGATPFKEGNVNDTYRGLILLPDGSSRGAIIKDLDPKQLANELLVSELAKTSGLPCPDAFLARVPQGVLSVSKGPQLGGGDRLVFASADVSVPNLTQRLNAAVATEQSAILDDLVNWIHLGALYAFDAWVANIDRHAGNLLYGGPNNIWLIDHGHCLTGPNWSPSDLDPDGSYTNRLREWVTPRLSSVQRSSRSSEASQFESQAKATDVGNIREQSQVSEVTSQDSNDAAQSFLSGRASKILFHANVALDNLI